MVKKNPFSWNSFIMSTISLTVLGLPICHPKAFSTTVLDSDRSYFLTISLILYCQHWSARCHTLLTPLLLYFHLAIFTSYFSNLWLKLLIGWLYSIDIFSFCPLLLKTSLFLLKRRSAEYLLNQSVRLLWVHLWP